MTANTVVRKFNRKLAARIKWKGYRYERDFARAAGIDGGRLSNIISLKWNPSESEIEKICTTLDSTPEELDLA